MTPPNGDINLRSPGNTPAASPTGSSRIQSSTSTTSPVPTSTSKTTSTSSNNYAAPNTPIASAKRPRNHSNASAIKSNGKSIANGRRSRSSIGTSQHTYGREIVMNQDSSLKKQVEEPLTPVRKMRLSDGNSSSNHDNNSNNRIQMSPMHKPRAAIEKDDKKKGELDENEYVEGTDGDSSESNSNNAKDNKWVGIFSPVLNFLNHSSEDGATEESNVDVDGDVAMKNEDARPTQLKSDLVEDDGEIDNETPTPTSAATYSVSLPHSQSSMDASEEYGVPVDDMDDDLHYEQESEVNNEEDEEDEDEFNPYLFIKFLPPYHVSVPHPENKICLPPKDKSDPPITLVLDLDETLVHCTVEPIHDASMVFPVYFNGMQYNVHVRTRPYLQEFLESVSKKFEVVVFTASQKVYADELLNRIDPDGKFIKHRMFRESCLLVEGNYIKDLNVLGRDLTSSVLVDNSPHAFGYQVDNGIPIESWFDDRNDVELMKLDQFLNTLHDVKDVRASVRSKFQTYKLVRDAR